MFVSLKFDIPNTCQLVCTQVIVNYCCFNYHGIVFCLINMFTLEEKIDMYNVYLQSGRNSYQALRLYREQFPVRELSNRRIFSKLEQTLRRTGSFVKAKKQYVIDKPELELNVLLCLEENPRTSVREISFNTGIAATTVHRILKNHNKRPYKDTPVQHLEEQDGARRLEFCNNFLQRQQEDPLFYTRILWSDESNFSNNGMFNRNHHFYWSSDNPRNVIETNFQRRFSTNVWCGIFGNKIIGPIFIDEHLNADRYNGLLVNLVDNHLEEIPLAQLRNIIFQQDGAPAHNAAINVAYLNQQFGRNWMGTYGPIRWPARSPDITPLDFFLWAYIKDVVYVTVPENLGILKARITGACENINPDMVLNAARAVIRRCQMCINRNGLQFEQFL